MLFFAFSEKYTFYRLNRNKFGRGSRHADTMQPAKPAGRSSRATYYLFSYVVGSTRVLEVEHYNINNTI